MIVRVFKDLGTLSQAAAEFFVAEAAAHEVFKVALAGGNTPKGLYELLASDPYRDQVDWSKVHIYFGDERWVPVTDPASNEGMARTELLSKVPIPEDQIHPMYLDGPVEEGAEVYEALMQEDGPLNLILLGMGDDGHTASLFPGIPELNIRDCMVVPTISPKGVPQRLTLTVPALRAAEMVLFLVAGADKHEKLGEAISSQVPAPPPSGVVAAQAQQAFWFVDQAAIDG